MYMAFDHQVQYFAIFIIRPFAWYEEQKMKEYYAKTAAKQREELSIVESLQQTIKRLKKENKKLKDIIKINNYISKVFALQGA